jgi:hypothetical protein
MEARSRKPPDFYPQRIGNPAAFRKKIHLTARARCKIFLLSREYD